MTGESFLVVIISTYDTGSRVVYGNAIGVRIAMSLHSNFLSSVGVARSQSALAPKRSVRSASDFGK